MKPIKIFLFVSFVIVALGITMLFFPKGEIEINNKFSLYFPSYSEMFVKQEEIGEKFNLDSLINIQVDLDTIVSINEMDSIEKMYPDINIEEIRNLIQEIEYPKNNAKVLNRFFARLNSKEKVRIIHYGDSQIEGDRMTSQIRNKLQIKFGGSGHGLNPIGKLYAQFSVVQTNSDNWNRYSFFAKRNKEVPHRNFGIMGAFSRFTPLKDTVNTDTLLPLREPENAWLQIHESKISYNNTKTFNRVKLFYGNAVCETHLKLIVDDQIVEESILKTDSNLCVYTYNADTTINNIRLEMEALESPDFYALSLENSESKITVDNVALRGSSGTFFTSLNAKLLSKMYADIKPNLFIMQFGGNSVPYLKDSLAAEQFGRYFSAQLNYLKKISPETDVLVIGPSDMSTKIKNKFVTYPLMEKIIDELKKVSFKNNCAYWDFYRAMGGKNSMHAYVEAKLASPDHVHLSVAGSRMIANMFYNALMLDYSNYKKNAKS